MMTEELKSVTKPLAYDVGLGMELESRFKHDILSQTLNIED